MTKPTYSNWVTLSLFLLAFLFYLNNGTAGGLPNDNSIYVYWGQQLLTGKLPYVSVFDHKGPLTGFVTALCIALGRVFGSADDVGAAITGFMLVNAVTATCIFCVTRIISRNVCCALLAYGLFFMCRTLTLDITRAPEPKTLAIMLQLVVLLSCLSSRWFLAGCFSMLSILTWQPSGISLIVAAVLLAQQKPLMRTWWHFAAGITAPLILCLFCYGLAGQMTLLYEGMIGFNLFDLHKPDIGERMGDMASNLSMYYSYYRWLILLGGGFLLIYLFARQSGLAPNQRLCLRFMQYCVVLWLGFTLFDYTFMRRIFVFIPYAAIGSSLALACVLDRLFPAFRVAGNKPVFAAVLLAFICVINLHSSWTLSKNPHFANEQNDVDEIYAASGNTDDVLTCNNLVYLILSKSTDRYNPYGINLPEIHDFLARSVPDGTDALADSIMQQKPKLIVTRKKSTCPFVAEAKKSVWNDWISANYDMSRKGSTIYYLRK